MHIIFFKLTLFIIKLNEAKNIGLGCLIHTIFISILSGAVIAHATYARMLIAFQSPPTQTSEIF
jgi:hypothetical protein